MIRIILMIKRMVQNVHVEIRYERSGDAEINDDTRIIEMKNVSNEGLLVFINE
jgi:hypothetical protein